MTTDHYLKSFLWFPYEPSKRPRNLLSVHKFHLLAFFSHWKCHLKKKKKSMTQFGIWSLPLVNGVAALSSRVKSEVVLSLSCGVPRESLERALETLLFGPEKAVTGKPSSPWITSVCVFSVPLPTVIKMHWKMIHFRETLFTVFRGQ